MNHIIDDRGTSVISIGAPGSLARVKVQWPRLIERLNALYFSAYESHGKAIDEAVEMIRDSGITSEMETTNIILSSHYKDEPIGSVTHIVCLVGTAKRTSECE